MTVDQEDDLACSDLKAGQVVAFSHDDLPKPPHREVTPQDPPSLQAVIVAVHDARTLTLQPVVYPEHPLATDRQVAVTIYTEQGEVTEQMSVVGIPYERVPRFLRSSSTGDRRNTWSLIQ
jgi:hypothetical protein